MERRRKICSLCAAVFLPLFLSGCAGQEESTETASPLPTLTAAVVSDTPSVSEPVTLVVSDVPDDDTPTPTQEAEASPTALPTPTDETAVKPDILEWYWGFDGVAGADLREYISSYLLKDEVEEIRWFIFFETELEDVYVTAPRVYGRYDDPPDPTPSLSDYDVYTFAEDAVYIMSSDTFDLDAELLGVQWDGGVARVVWFRTTKETWQREQKRAYSWICGVKDKVIYYVYPFVSS